MVTVLEGPLPQAGAGGPGAGAGGPGVRGGPRPTEQSFRWVWMQPEWSFWTQQPEPRSRSHSRCTSCAICPSRRMQGENLAPRWIKSICGGREWARAQLWLC